MDWLFTDDQRLLRDTVARLMARHAPPEAVRRWDEERTYPDALYRAWIEAVLLALPFPEDYGGAYGYSMEFDMQRHFRDSRAATIAAGSSQMLRNIIASLKGNKVR